MAYNNPRTQVSAKKKSSGLGSMLGGLLGAGSMTGGFSPATAETPAFEPDSYDAAVAGTNNARGGTVPQGVSAKPASFSPYTLEHPVLDAIFNRGAGAAQANGYNAQMGLMQFQNENSNQQAELNRQIEIKKQELADKAAGDRIGLTGDETRKSYGFNSDVNQASSKGVSSHGMQNLFDVTDRPNISTAGNIAQARAGNSATPEASNLIANAQNAEWVMPVAQVQRMSNTELPQNGAVMQQDYGMGYGNKMMSGPQQYQTTEMMGGIPTNIGGRTVNVGAKPEVTTKRTQPVITDLDAQKAEKEDTIMRALAANMQRATAGNSSVAPSNPAMANNPSGFPVSAKPANSAMLPQLRDSLNQWGEGAVDYMNPMKDDSAIVDIIRKLFNSNFKGTPSAKPSINY